MMKRLLLRKLTVMVLRTYPPICKNSNGRIARFKRAISAILINIIVGGKSDEYENFLKQEITHIKAIL